MIEKSSADAIVRMDRRYEIAGIQEIVNESALVPSRASGPYIYGADGTEYIDFFTGVGVGAIGHSHPRLVQALKDQIDQWMIGTFFSRPRSELLEQLAMLLPEALRSIQLYSTGAEAVEAAIKIARAATSRATVVSFWGAYHGKTLATLALHGGARKQGYAGLPGPVVQIPYADCSDCPLSLRFPSCDVACLDLGRRQLEASLSEPPAAIIVEPVLGTAGNICPPPGFLIGVQQLAREFGSVLILDEVITGLGRTGQTFGFQREPGVAPDIVVLGKALGSGMPISAIAVKNELVAQGPFAKPSSGSSTFGGNPLSCAAADVTLQILADEHATENAAILGERFLARTAEWPDRYPLVRATYGAGLALGIQLSPDVGRDLGVGRAVFHAFLDEGLLAMAYSPRIRLYPPLNIEAAIFDEGLDRIERALVRTNEVNRNSLGTKVTDSGV